MRNLLGSVIATVIVLSPLAAFGQAATPVDAPTATPAQPAAAPATATPATLVAPVAPVAAPPIAFTWEALVDAYYMYNFTGKPSLQAQGSRQFDVAANSFSLNYAKLGVGRTRNMSPFAWTWARVTRPPSSTGPAPRPVRLVTPCRPVSTAMTSSCNRLLPRSKRRSG